MRVNGQRLIIRGYESGAMIPSNSKLIAHVHRRARFRVDAERR